MVFSIAKLHSDMKSYLTLVRLSVAVGESMAIAVVLGRKRFAADFASPRFDPRMHHHVLFEVLRIDERSVANLAVVGPFSRMNASNVVLKQPSPLETLIASHQPL